MFSVVCFNGQIQLHSTNKVYLTSSLLLLYMITFSYCYRIAVINMVNCFLHFFLYFYFTYLFPCAMCVNAHVEVRKQFWGTALLSPCGPGFWTRVLVLGSRHLYPLSCLQALSYYGKFLEAGPKVSIHISCFVFQQGQCGIIPLRIGFHLCHLLAERP